MRNNTKEIKECDCTQCKRNCPHKDAFRRLPKEIGGLGLCNNLNKEYKLRIYDPNSDGEFDHEEFFDNIDDLNKRYKEIRKEIDNIIPFYETHNHPTAWKRNSNRWTRIAGY